MIMDQPREIELVFAPQEEGGYHVYAPDLPGLHTQGNERAATGPVRRTTAYGDRRRAMRSRTLGA